MNTPQKPVIAIDGPAASGKGTLARKIASTLGYAHMDTGALYRAVGYEILQVQGNPSDEAAAVNAAQTLVETLKQHNPADTLGREELRSDETGQAASKVAAITAVREILLSIQYNFAKNPGQRFAGAVLDGRDIGTVICPHADVKLYVTASVEIRAQRRTKELQSKGIAVTYEAVLKDMRERDERDSGRTTAPMKPADDAIILDTSALTPDDMLQKALTIITTKLEN